jgi:hypothetical protein
VKVRFLDYKRKRREKKFRQGADECSRAPCRCRFSFHFSSSPIGQFLHRGVRRVRKERKKEEEREREKKEHIAHLFRTSTVVASSV